MTTTALPPTPQKPKRTRTWLTWILVAVAAVVVLAVAVPFVYIHFLSGDAPAPLSLQSGPSNAPSSTGAYGANGAAPGGAVSLASLNGTWTVTSGSQAGYRVKEVLVGQSTEAVGRTSSVTGSATIAGTQLTKTDMTVDMKSVTSDKSQRDGQFQTRIMNTAQFPTATFTLTKPIDLSSLPTDGTVGTTTATGNLTLHGVTKTVDIPLQVKVDGANIDVNGSLAIPFADYQIDNPSNGPAQVGDGGTLEFLVKLAKS
jgi:polyisoprenoid-binding protein YceI